MTPAATAVAHLTAAHHAVATLFDPATLGALLCCLAVSSLVVAGLRGGR